MKKHYHALAIAVAFVSCMISVARAEFPERPVRVVVGFAPGVGMEVNTRLLADLITKAAGANVIIENKPGASGIIAANTVLQSPKDGYTMLMLNNQHYANQLMFAKQPYKTEDFIPVAGGGVVTMVLAASKNLSVNNVAELVAYAKSKPDDVPFGHWGVGGSAYLLPKKFEMDNGVKLKEVAYRDSGQLMADLLTGRISLFFTSLTQILPFVNNGQVKLLAINTAERTPALPDVPTFVESGVTGMPAPWWGYGLAAGAPAEAVAKLHKIIFESTKSPDYRDRLKVSGAEPLITDSPEKFKEFVAKQNQLWDSIIRSLNIKVDN